MTTRTPSWFDRLWAAGYDAFMDRIDRRGGLDHRRRVVEDAGGEVLEVGAGSGKNLPLYRAAVRVVAMEPDPGMRARAERAAGAATVPVEVVDGDATALPFPDDTFDTVVMSLVLCTIPDPRRALEEARRVLRNGGTLRFYEHVRAADPRLARWQDRLARPWRWFGRGCHPNRDTLGTIRRAGFELAELDEFDFHAPPPIVRPHVLGVATPVAR
ncbi:MAG: class I SAM-dependent methyltransferase [Acidimicrobiales bacterium]